MLARALCARHYRKLKKYGDALTPDKAPHGRDKGFKHSPATVEKIRLSKIGKPKKQPRGFKKPNSSKDTHWNWKGGLTERDNLERHLFGRTTRLAVLERDNYTCQVCNKHGGDLHVDHLKSWKDFPELRNDTNNCRTLCVGCHYYVTFKKQLNTKTSLWGKGSTKAVS